MLPTAAALLTLLGVAHSYLGERYILIRLFKRDNLPKLFGGTEFTTGTIRFAWHLTTVAWWGIAVIIFQASGKSLEAGAALQVFAAVAFVSGLLALFFSRGKHLSWVVFFVVATLLWLAAVTT